MAYQSEADLEKQLIDQLVKQGFEQVIILDEAALETNFRHQVQLHNEADLAGEPLTDIEFSRILVHLKGKSVFRSAQLLREKYPLERENGQTVYLDFFDSQQWCKNRFQVTNQTTIQGKYENRYDVTILINGLPVVQIELKRRGIELKEAFNQIMRYKNHSFTGLYRYLQLFVVSNGVESKYFANNDKELNYQQTFYWSDECNQRLQQLQEFAADLLEPCRLAKMLARYMVINETDKTMLVMRPYQVYAVEALVKRAEETANNGYIWHTTGSGKTLTSFKASQIISRISTIKKVFFLVDRKDLDAQTISEFNKFSPDSVDITDKTDTLVKQITDIRRPLIVTTIQKMAHAIKNPRYSQIMTQYKNERIVFIIDECHRSQFGDMHKAINIHFTKAQYFGFTGTPRFFENKSQEGRTTADLFQTCLHTYLIKDAISDGNVLGFSTEMIKTFDAGYDPDDDTQVEAIDTAEIFENEIRLGNIVQHIVQNHDIKTRNRKYTAIFTVPSIPLLVKYYDLFKRYNDKNLKIAGIFTFGANEDSEGRDEHSRDSLERMIHDYNEIFKTNYSTDTFSNYFTDVSKKVKRAEIDILIVVNMFLTGFDSKLLNTLYIDKNLKYHDLIQAYSRTNRIESSEKPFGNIVSYRNLKKRTDDAIRLFSQTDSTDVVLMESMGTYVEQWQQFLVELQTLAPTPESVTSLIDEEDQLKFVKCFQQLAKLLLRLETFTEFSFDSIVLGLSEQMYQDYRSHYFTLYEETKKLKGQKVSVLQDIDFVMEVMFRDKINVHYILELINQIDLTNPTKRDVDIQVILDKLNRNEDPQLKSKIELIEAFLRQVVPTLEADDSIAVHYQEFIQKHREQSLAAFAQQIGLATDKVDTYISEYEYSGLIDGPTIDSDIRQDLKLGLKSRKTMRQKITDFIFEHVELYTY
ncbi:MAG: type I restriction endonuclease subunit R [Culicoidibacterales bacterium]